MQNKLNILLVEDTEVHREAAKQQLSQHNLIICANYAEFADEAKKMVLENRTVDVILTDCLMPAQNVQALAYKRDTWEGQEVSFGPSVLLFAIKQNIKHAGLLMLNNHHDHPIAASFDVVNFRNHKEPFQCGQTRLLITTGDYFDDTTTGEKYEGIAFKGSFVKRWDLFLEKLLGE